MMKQHHRYWLELGITLVVLALTMWAADYLFR
jgi:hypothetical protein